MATTSRSVYLPLGPRNIRLLHLEAGQPDDPIQFSLESVSLDSDPIYEAISYCWGDHNDRQHVTCSGIPMPITTSLWGALRELRHSVGNRILWADGVCMNQKDEGEKTRQVRLMQEIYAKAKMVLVWLGPVDEEGRTFHVCTSIKKLHEFLPDLTVPLSPEARQSFVAEMANRDRREGRATIGEHDWTALVELVGRPWFTRKWVAQEVALAQEARLYIGGGVQLPWADLSSLANKIDSLGVLPLIVKNMGPKDRKALDLGLYNIRVMQGIQHFRAAGRGTLVDAVMATRGLSCSDHHDHIYGVLSCASEGPTLDPNYALSVEETFRKFCMVMLTEGQQLKVLSLEPHKGSRAHPGVPRNSKELPSWVPDLRRPSDPLATTSVQAQNFHAGGPNKPVLSLSNDGRVLNCQGIIVDEIEDFVTSMHEMLRDEVPEVFDSKSALPGAVDPSLQSSQLRFRQWLQKCYDLGYNRASFVDNTGRKDAFSRTLLCDQGKSAGGQAGADMISATFDWAECVLFQDYTLSPQERLDRMSREQPSLAKLWPAIERDIAYQANMRNFAVTTGGRLGQMPMGTERGDLVCVLIGGEVPFVLRATDHCSSSYELIGDCFLDGIMNGEMLLGDAHTTEEIVLV